MNTVQLEWETYFSLVMPDGASEQQEADMKQCFYAGSIVMLDLMLTLSDGTKSQQAEEAILQGLIDELDYFSSTVMKGEKL